MGLTLDLTLDLLELEYLVQIVDRVPAGDARTLRLKLSLLGKLVEIAERAGSSSPPSSPSAVEKADKSP